MFMAPSRSSVEVEAKPFAQNTRVARSSASSRSNSLGLTTTRVYLLWTNLSITIRCYWREADPPTLVQRGVFTMTRVNVCIQRTFGHSWSKDGCRERVGFVESCSLSSPEAYVGSRRYCVHPKNPSPAEPPASERI